MWHPMSESPAKFPCEIIFMQWGAHGGRYLDTWLLADLAEFNYLRGICNDSMIWTLAPTKGGV